MCMVCPARVVAIDGADAIVDLDGRARRASLVLVPQTAVHDWVLIGAGHVLRTLEPEEANALAAELHAAMAATQRQADHRGAPA